jgi:hypothetical protein
LLSLTPDEKRVGVGKTSYFGNGPSGQSNFEMSRKLHNGSHPIGKKEKKIRLERGQKDLEEQKPETMFRYSNPNPSVFYLLSHCKQAVFQQE